MHVCNRVWLDYACIYLCNIICIKCCIDVCITLCVMYVSLHALIDVLIVYAFMLVLWNSLCMCLYVHLCVYDVLHAVV